MLLLVGLLGGNVVVVDRLLHGCFGFCLVVWVRLFGFGFAEVAGSIFIFRFFLIFTFTVRVNFRICDQSRDTSFVVLGGFYWTA